MPYGRSSRCVSRVGTRDDQGTKLKVSTFAPSTIVASVDAKLQSRASARTHDSTSPALIPCQLRLVTAASSTVPSLASDNLSVISPLRSRLS